MHFRKLNGFLIYFIALFIIFFLKILHNLSSQNFPCPGFFFQTIFNVFFFFLMIRRNNFAKITRWNFSRGERECLAISSFERENILPQRCIFISHFDFHCTHRRIFRSFIRTARKISYHNVTVVRLFEREQLLPYYYRFWPLA